MRLTMGMNLHWLIVSPVLIRVSVFVQVYATFYTLVCVCVWMCMGVRYVYV